MHELGVVIEPSIVRDAVGVIDYRPGLRARCRLTSLDLDSESLVQTFVIPTWALTARDNVARRHKLSVVVRTGSRA